MDISNEPTDFESKASTVSSVILCEQQTTSSVPQLDDSINLNQSTQVKSNTSKAHLPVSTVRSTASSIDLPPVLSSQSSALPIDSDSVSHLDPLRRTLNWQSEQLALTCKQNHSLTSAASLSLSNGRQSKDTFDFFPSIDASKSIQSDNKPITITHERDATFSHCSTMNDGKQQTFDCNLKSQTSDSLTEPNHLRPSSRATTVSTDEQCSLDSIDSSITNRSRDSDQHFEKQLSLNASSQNSLRGRGRPSGKQSHLSSNPSSRPGSRSPVNSSEQQEFGWDCSVCTYRNSSETFKCLICDVRKGMSTRKPRVNPQVLAAQVARQQRQIQEQVRKASAKQAEKSKTNSNTTSNTMNNSSADKRRAEKDADNPPIKTKRKADSNPSKTKQQSDSKEVKNESKLLNAKIIENDVSSTSFDRNKSKSQQITINNVTIEIVEYQLKSCAANSISKSQTDSSTGKKNSSLSKSKT